MSVLHNTFVTTTPFVHDGTGTLLKILVERGMPGGLITDVPLSKDLLQAIQMISIENEEQGLTNDDILFISYSAKGLEERIKGHG